MYIPVVCMEELLWRSREFGLWYLCELQFLTHSLSPSPSAFPLSLSPSPSPYPSLSLSLPLPLPIPLSPYLRLNLPGCLPQFYVRGPDPLPVSKGKKDWFFGSAPVEMDRSSVCKSCWEIYSSICLTDCAFCIEVRGVSTLQTIGRY